MIPRLVLLVLPVTIFRFHFDSIAVCYSLFLPSINLFSENTDTFILNFNNRHGAGELVYWTNSVFSMIQRLIISLMGNASMPSTDDSVLVFRDLEKSRLAEFHASLSGLPPPDIRIIDL